MTAPETYTVDRAALERVFWSAFHSGAMSALHTVNPAGGAERARDIASQVTAAAEYATSDEAWRGILAKLSGVAAPPAHITVTVRHGGGSGA